MLEIFAFPYFVVSGVIGWSIFAPFVHVDVTGSLSRSKVTITDLLAVSFTVSMFVATACWMMPETIRTVWVQVLVLVMALLFAALALTAGLFLVPKSFQVTFLQRMAIVGVVAPSGILLTVGWIGLPVWACFQSISYFAPSMIVIAAATAGLRMVALWICRSDSSTKKRTAEASAAKTVE